jgi:VanZ family protein
MNFLLSLLARRAYLFAWFVLTTTLFLIRIPFRLDHLQSFTTLPLGPIVHSVAHFVLLASAAWLSRLNGFSITATVLCWACYGAGIEVMQSFTSYREGRFVDWIYDMIGIALGLVLYARTVGPMMRSLARDTPEVFASVEPGQSGSADGGSEAHTRRDSGQPAYRLR